MKLNKEDLMIGDWVMIKDYPMVSEPLRMTENHFVRSLCEFEAIPINEEFLLKNGFTFIPIEPIFGYGIFKFKTENCLIRYSNKHGDIQINKSNGGINPENGNCTHIGDIYEINCGQFRISYVHELQHILKLCKIDLKLTC